MPLVTIKAPEAVFSDEQKKAMIEQVTEAMVEVEGEDFRDKTWVVYEEVPKQSWAIGGELIGPR
jgi:4-oxalocrotonate tautomerase